MVNYKTVSQFSIESGFTEAAIRRMISQDIWKEREVWVRVGGRVLITVKGYHNWVEVEAGLELFQKQPSRSPLSSVASGVEKTSKLSLQLPTY